jgi:hypothetical protein
MEERQPDQALGRADRHSLLAPLLDYGSSSSSSSDDGSGSEDEGGLGQPQPAMKPLPATGGPLSPAAMIMVEREEWAEERVEEEELELESSRASTPHPAGDSPPDPVDPVDAELELAHFLDDDDNDLLKGDEEEGQDAHLLYLPAEDPADRATRRFLLAHLRAQGMDATYGIPPLPPGPCQDASVEVAPAPASALLHAVCSRPLNTHTPRNPHHTRAQDKFRTWTRLKLQGTRFNERLVQTHAFQNPSIIHKMTSFIGVQEGGSAFVPGSVFARVGGGGGREPERVDPVELRRRQEALVLARDPARERVAFLPAGRKP